MDESSIYIYCLCKTGLLLPHGSKGLGGNPLCLITWKEVSAVVSNAQKGSYPSTPENALLHEQVVEKIHLLSPVIPMRFSSLVPGKTSVVDLLRNNYQSIRNALERLEGRIEVSLRLLLPTDNERPPARSPTSMAERVNRPPLRGARESARCKSPPSGEEYLLERQRFYNLKDNPMNRWTDIVVFISHQLYPYWEKIRHERLNHHSSILCLYFLLRKERLEDFLQSIEWLRRSYPELKLLFSGPWPPYNFVPNNLIQKG